MNTQEIQAKANELKKKHGLGRVVTLAITPKTDGKLEPERTKVAFLKPLTRIILKAALMGTTKADIADTIIQQCWLDGDAEIKDEVEYWYLAIGEVTGMLPEGEAALKNF